MVTDALELQGLDVEDKERDLHSALYHGLIAVGIYAVLPPWFQQKFDEICNLISPTFRHKMKLKKVRRKSPKRKIPPTPPIKENTLLVERKETSLSAAGAKSSDGKEEIDEYKAFKAKVYEFNTKYSQEMLDGFILYWCDVNQKNGKMRWQEARYFHIGRRLAKWSKTSYHLQDEAASIKLDRTKKVKKSEPVNLQDRENVNITKQQEIASKQQEIAREREAANRKREEEQAEAKRGAVTMEEALGNNPTGALGKLMKKSNKNQ